MVMTGGKTAVILESWKRIPQILNFKPKSCLKSSTPALPTREKSALVWMFSRNLRARPVAFFKVFFNLYSRQAGQNSPFGQCR